MSPLIFVTIGVIAVTTPALFWATWFCWHLYRDDRTNGAALALALMVTAASVAFDLLAVPTVLFVFGKNSPAAGLLVLVSLDILGPAAVGVPAYLRWTRGRSE